MQLWDKNVVFSYKDTQIQYSVSDHIRFTAKNNKLFWKYSFFKITKIFWILFTFIIIYIYIYVTECIVYMFRAMTL